MKDLNLIIASLSEEEKQNCRQYLQKRNKRNDTKNLQLFKLLSQGELNLDELSKHLYNSTDK